MCSLPTRCPETYDGSRCEVILILPPFLDTENEVALGGGEHGLGDREQSLGGGEQVDSQWIYYSVGIAAIFITVGVWIVTIVVLRRRNVERESQLVEEKGLQLGT